MNPDSPLSRRKRDMVCEPLRPRCSRVTLRPMALEAKDRGYGRWDSVLRSLFGGPKTRRRPFPAAEGTVRVFPAASGGDDVVAGFSSRLEGPWVVGGLLMREGSDLVVGGIALFPAPASSRRRSRGTLMELAVANEVGVVPHGGVTSDVLRKVPMGSIVSMVRTELMEEARRDRRLKQELG